MCGYEGGGVVIGGCQRNLYATRIRPGEGGNTGYDSKYLERRYTEACCNLLTKQQGVGYNKGCDTKTGLSHSESDALPVVLVHTLAHGKQISSGR